jgi:hypothetical protein
VNHRIFSHEGIYNAVKSMKGHEGEGNYKLQITNYKQITNYNDQNYKNK